ncbi:MAG: hypothetical protein ABR880_18320 [Candidatus Sulfotelmatobacter sp.]
MEDIQTQETEQTEETTEPQDVNKRRKSARRALEDCCDRLESVINDPKQKPAKVIDALQKVADIRIRLLEYDARQKEDRNKATIEQLGAKSVSDDAKIASLTSKRETPQQMVNATSDPRVAEQQTTIANLKSFIKHLASEFNGDKAQVSISVILKFGRVAREYVTGLGIDFDAYFSNLNSSSVMTEANLRASVDPPDNEDLHTMLNRPGVGAEFAVAALAVVYQVDIKAPVRRVNGASSPRDYAALAADQFND